MNRTTRVHGGDSTAPTHAPIPSTNSVTLSWLIIGGGIHGVHLATRLIGEAGVPVECVRILDPGERLLVRWRACTTVTGMKHLRSPSVHHLGVETSSLSRFSGQRRNRKPGLFAYPYDRPALALFDAHCDRLIADHALDSIHVRGRAIECRFDSDTVVTKTSTGQTLRAKKVVLALGATDQLEWPSWARIDDPRVAHIFDAGFAYPSVPTDKPIAVVGGGISAAQVALRLHADGHKVHLVSRHELREHQFDSAPGWQGPKFMARFNRETSVKQRRQLIATARNKGSLPPDVRATLRREIKAGNIVWHNAEVNALDVDDRKLTLSISGNEQLNVDRILLATGFTSQRPGGAMLDAFIQSESLPCAPCGYPIVDTALRWHPNVYVTGPLAELELGPVARNIAGARRAGDRLVASLRDQVVHDEHHG